MFFFFKQKTAYEIYQCDWSSDVCSSDLTLKVRARTFREAADALGLDDIGAQVLRTRVSDVSRYATTNVDEFVAEYFAASLEGRTFHPDLTRLYEVLGGPPVLPVG